MAITEDFEFIDIDKISSNIIESWQKCYDNHIFIENTHGLEFNIDNIINIKNESIIKRTLYFDKCSDLNIIINKKINNVILNKCKNINIKISSGLISGLSIFNCEFIDIQIVRINIIHNEISKSENCSIHYNLDEMIQLHTQDCFMIKIKTNQYEKITNQSLFNHTSIFNFSNDYFYSKFII
jgi:hypothetical protein